VCVDDVASSIYRALRSGTGGTGVTPSPGIHRRQRVDVHGKPFRGGSETPGTPASDAGGSEYGTEYGGGGGRGGGSVDVAAAAAAAADARLGLDRFLNKYTSEVGTDG
jgi:hypothetical protein